MGHCGLDATIDILREHRTWHELREHVSELFGVCILCVTARTGTKISRPLASTTHGSNFNEVLHSGYLKLGDARDGFE